jgi:hypothetical protein
VTLLSTFGLFAVTAMLVTYTLEQRSHWFVLAFAAACALGSIYGFLQGAWPFGLVEAVWSIVAVRRWGKCAQRVRLNSLRTDYLISTAAHRHVHVAAERELAARSRQAGWPILSSPTEKASRRGMTVRLVKIALSDRRRLRDVSQFKQF